ncbi:putative sulfate exporter family transporter [Staphylococcus arlettae]|uniref:YeiH family protein n=1 Tax=Staphylococcus arlettae TaxID=29378 RepID=UPI0010718A20|nr:putative sulfate exporter family transporter [Staphylococcus arlettae]MBF0737073.1 putative sulfate exporter family transporter [Staphylococcus arlettae]TFU48223.1 putative sulfate exporter family transporter [Staphylococcus arlettae]
MFGLQLKQYKVLSWLLGVVFTFAIAGIGYVLALLPGFDRVGQMACAIIIAVVFRQLFGYPRAIQRGIKFSSFVLLRVAIVLYGLKLNITIIFNEGLGLLLRDACIVALAIIVMLSLAKLFKADKMISLLVGVGTGICGAAAIAAIAPIVKAKEEDTAIGVGMIALVGTVFAIGYTMLAPVLSLTPVQYGTWSGMSLHELAHVAVAAAPAGNEAMALGLLTKLGRVFLLVPVAFIFMYLMKRKQSSTENDTTKIPFPWFLIGFIIMSIIGSYVLGPMIPVASNVMNSVSTLTTWLLTVAMVGLGLNVNLADLRQRAFKPLMAMLITSIIVSGIAYLLV